MISLCCQGVLFFIASSDKVSLELREDGEQTVKLSMREWRDDDFVIVWDWRPNKVL